MSAIVREEGFRKIVCPKSSQGNPRGGIKGRPGKSKEWKLLKDGSSPGFTKM